MLDAGKIVHRSLRQYWERGDSSKIHAKWRAKIGRVLHALDVATSPLELNLPGYGLHELTTPRKGTWSVTISRNWRLTFKWRDEGPYDVDLEDYHGK